MLVDFLMMQSRRSVGRWPLGGYHTHKGERESVNIGGKTPVAPLEALFVSICHLTSEPDMEPATALIGLCFCLSFGPLAADNTTGKLTLLVSLLQSSTDLSNLTKLLETSLCEREKNHVGAKKY